MEILNWVCFTPWLGLICLQETARQSFSLLNETNKEMTAAEIHYDLKMSSIGLNHSLNPKPKTPLRCACISNARITVSMSLVQWLFGQKYTIKQLPIISEYIPWQPTDAGIPGQWSLWNGKWQWSKATVAPWSHTGAGSLMVRWPLLGALPRTAAPQTAARRVAGPPCHRGDGGHVAAWSARWW